MEGYSSGAFGKKFVIILLLQMIIIIKIEINFFFLYNVLIFIERCTIGEVFVEKKKVASV